MSRSSRIIAFCPEQPSNHLFCSLSQASGYSFLANVDFPVREGPHIHTPRSWPGQQGSVVLSLIYSMAASTDRYCSRRMSPSNTACSAPLAMISRLRLATSPFLSCLAGLTPQVHGPSMRVSSLLQQSSAPLFFLTIQKCDLLQCCLRDETRFLFWFQNCKKYCRCGVPSFPFSSYPVTQMAPASLYHFSRQLSHMFSSGLFSVHIHIIPLSVIWSGWSVVCL